MREPEHAWMQEVDIGLPDTIAGGAGDGAGGMEMRAGG